MTDPSAFTSFTDRRPAVLVVSHERSGTHFLMNALAECYGYVSQPWINFDMPTQNVLDHYSRDQLREILVGLAERRIANIVKSHHSDHFFSGQLERLTDHYVIFVIYRDPVAVMLSYWRFMFCFPASNNVGPQVADPLTFARAAPFGRMLRYQSRRFDSVLERWAAHVDGWRLAAQTLPRIVLVRYEDLDARFEATVQSFSDLLERPPESLTRPARDFNIVPGGPADPTGTGVAPDLKALRQLCRQTVGDTMARLGY